MPRAAHPIDGVLKYFHTVEISVAEITLHVIKGILKERREAPMTLTGTGPLPVPAPPKKRRAKRVKPTTLTQDQVRSELAEG